MINYLICKKCNEVEDKHAKTGARIDGQYYCQTCYEEEMDRLETGWINEVFGREVIR